ncbi:hypothetical protein JNUCC64_23545 [Streptomyces sp. JNUCC 64]
MIGRLRLRPRDTPAVLADPVPLYVTTGTAAGITAPRTAYRALVFAEGPVIGTARRGRTVLGSFTSPYPGRVLRWLRKQALRIADGLDPDPSATACPVTLLHVDPDAHPHDVPATLRDWAHRDGTRAEARRRLLAGEPFALLSSDHSGAYALTAWPLSVTTTPTTGREP